MRVTNVYGPLMVVSGVISVDIVWTPIIHISLFNWVTN